MGPADGLRFQDEEDNIGSTMVSPSAGRMELSETIGLERKETEGIVGPGTLFLPNETRGCIICWTQKEHWWSRGASL